MPDPAVQRRRVVAGAIAAVLALGSATAGALTGAGGDERSRPPKPRSPRPRPGPPRAAPRRAQHLPRSTASSPTTARRRTRSSARSGSARPASAARRLERQAKAYARPGRPVLPALELIAVIANADAGDDGMYRTRQTDAVIGRYLRAARKAKALLLLDIQPGRLGLLHGGHAARALAARAGRRPRARPRVAGAGRPGAGAGDRQRRLARGQRRDRVAGAAHRARGAPGEAGRDPPVHRRHGRRHARCRPRDGLQIVLNADGFGTRARQEVQVRRVHAPGAGLRAAASSSSTARTWG